MKKFYRQVFIVQYLLKGLSVAKNCLRPESAPLMRVVAQKIYSKVLPVSCTNNTHREVTDLVNHGLVKNAKTWNGT